MRRTDAAVLATCTVAGAALLGSRWRPTPDNPRDVLWYASLHKPALRPPGAVIGVAWAVLDVTLAYAGGRLLAAPPTPARTTALAGWGASVSGLATYPFLMFGRHRLGAALAAVLGMLGATLTTVAAASAVDRRAARALLPLVGWLCFAGVLQEEIWRRNR